MTYSIYHLQGECGDSRFGAFVAAATPEEAIAAIDAAMACDGAACIEANANAGIIGDCRDPHNPRELCRERADRLLATGKYRLPLILTWS